MQRGQANRAAACWLRHRHGPTANTDPFTRAAPAAFSSWPRAVAAGCMAARRSVLWSWMTGLQAQEADHGTGDPVSWYAPEWAQQYACTLHEAQRPCKGYAAACPASLLGKNSCHASHGVRALDLAAQLARLARRGVGGQARHSSRAWPSQQRHTLGRGPDGHPDDVVAQAAA